MKRWRDDFLCEFFGSLAFLSAVTNRLNPDRKNKSYKEYTQCIKSVPYFTITHSINYSLSNKNVPFNQFTNLYHDTSQLFLYITCLCHPFLRFQACLHSRANAATLEYRVQSLAVTGLLIYLQDGILLEIKSTNLIITKWNIYF